MHGWPLHRVLRDAKCQGGHVGSAGRRGQWGTPTMAPHTGQARELLDKDRGLVIVLLAKAAAERTGNNSN